MAEIKTGIFAKNVQKKLSRAQEKVLQKLGKADETKDEQFEQCVQNFKRQESEGARLQREMKAYIAAVKGMQQASMNLTESLHEVYEPDWHGRDDVMSVGKSCDALWEDFHEKLVDSTILALDTYLAQFPDIKMRVAKRSRKLIDYDSARHHLETLHASGIKNDRKIAKAEEDLKKAQKVFDDLNVDLQDELPSLWDNRVGFYVNTFKSVSSLEAKFHREISIFCHKLYEVMNKLAEQHSDKMFTIQGAPSDSGPLRLARTPTPPEDESPEGSPAVSPNHTLRPTSPGPPRPKSPSQLKMGPPKPPPPKVTPTKEIAQEQIINLFDGGFPEISVTSPQSNEKPTESLLDLDFDPFKPDSKTTIGQTQSPASQALSWDLWTTNTDTQPASDGGFNANWTADFGSTAQDLGDVQPATDGQGWPPAEGWPTDTVPKEESTGEVRSWDTVYDQQSNPNCETCALRTEKIELTFEQQHVQEDTEEGRSSEQSGSYIHHCEWREKEEGWTTERNSTGIENIGAEKSMPGIIFTDEFGQEITEVTKESVQGSYREEEVNNSKWYLTGQGEVDGSGSDYETAEECGDTSGQNSGWISADDELEPAQNEGPISKQDVTSSSLNPEVLTNNIDSFHTAQSTTTDPSCNDHTFKADCDELAMTESKKPNEAKELDHQSSTNYVFSMADPTHNTEQNQSVDNLFLNVSVFKLCSDPFYKSECEKFGSEPDPFAASVEDPFDTGSDSFSNLDNNMLWLSNSENCPLSQNITNDPFAIPQKDLFRSHCSSTDGFATDHIQVVDMGAAEITSHLSAGETYQDPLASEDNQDPFCETIQCLFGKTDKQDPFPTETHQDTFANETIQDPFATETNQDPFASDNGQDSFSGETVNDPLTTVTYRNPFASNAEQNLFPRKMLQDHPTSNINWDPFACAENQDPFTRDSNQDHFASAVDNDPLANETQRDQFVSSSDQNAFTTVKKQKAFASDTDHNSFVSETDDDTFARQTIEDLFANTTNQGSFPTETKLDPFASEAIQNVLPSEITWAVFGSEDIQDPFIREINKDNFATESNQHPFAQESVEDPFTSETQWDCFSTVNNQNPFTNETNQDHSPSEINWGPFATEKNQDFLTSELNKDPFAGEDHANWDTFSTEIKEDYFPSETHQDSPACNNTKHYFSIESNPDPFDSLTNQNLFSRSIYNIPTSRETTQDSLTTDDNLEWTGGWESIITRQASWKEMDFSIRNGFDQREAVPTPTSNLKCSSKDSCQDLEDTSEFFLSDGQADINTGWPGDSGRSQDQFLACPGQNSIPIPKTEVVEKAASIKETENSDLSEDEVTNRRYGKLYQELDTEKEEVSELLLILV